MHAFADQFFLLNIDPQTGKLFPVPGQVLQLALAGALLIDASFTGLINDDWKQLNVLSTRETGNQALDEAMRCLVVCEQ